MMVISHAVTVNNIACITYDQVVKAFGKCAKDAGYKSIEDVPKDRWLWQNSSTMDNPEDFTDDMDIINLVELLMDGSVDKDPRNVIWEG